MKQKTAIRQLIERCKVRIRELSVDSLNRVHRKTENDIKINGLLEAIEFAESLEPVNEMQIKDAFNYTDENLSTQLNGQEYFDKTFEKP